jgi:hypothetical protein
MMPNVQIKIPDFLLIKVDELTKREQITIDHFISLELAEKLSALMTEEYLEERAKKGSREAFDKILSKAPDVEPEKYDQL